MRPLAEIWRRLGTLHCRARGDEDTAHEIVLQVDDLAKDLRAFLVESGYGVYVHEQTAREQETFATRVLLLDADIELCHALSQGRSLDNAKDADVRDRARGSRAYCISRALAMVVAARGTIRPIVELGKP